VVAGEHACRGLWRTTTFRCDIGVSPYFGENTGNSEVRYAIFKKDTSHLAVHDLVMYCVIKLSASSVVTQSISGMVVTWSPLSREVSSSCATWLAVQVGADERQFAMHLG
jgi:hypothetical protein